MGTILISTLQGGALGFLLGVVVGVVFAQLALSGPGSSGLALSPALGFIALIFAVFLGAIGLAVGAVAGIIKRFKQRGEKADDGSAENRHSSGTTQA